MAGAKRVATPSRDQKIVMWLKGGGVLAACLAGVALCVAGMVSNDSDTTVPPPVSSERTETVTLLSRAAQAQGVCYGWQLRDNGTVVSEGSNLGDGIGLVDGSPGCARWAVVVADIEYTSSSSESEDSAYVTVRNSSDLHQVDFVGGLERLGLDKAAYIDDPGWAISRAATFLPLLAAEAGQAPVAPAGATQSGGATPIGTPSPLPTAGSDFWRDRWGYLLAAIGVLLTGVLLLAIGWFERRHEVRRRTSGRSGSLASRVVQQ